MSQSSNAVKNYSTDSGQRIFTPINENRPYHEFTLSERLVGLADDPARTLKTFTGVFCPVALAQFSSLMFLRLGFVIGQTGLLLGLLQLIMAYIILVVTILSICAISTNGAIKGGGVYFMISRTLGPEIGGSIGILFFLANVFSAALYMAGFVEGLIDDFGPDGRIHAGGVPDSPMYHYLFASCVCVFCLVICLIGGAMFAKTNLFIFLIVFVCYTSAIVTFFFMHAMEVKIPRTNKIVYHNSSRGDVCANYTGLSGTTFKANLYYDYYENDFQTNEKMNFLSIFGILFAGVTGIMNGANMSGELKKPAVSIPVGTMSATAFTFSCYILASLLTAATCDRYLLLNNYLYMQAINYWRPFVMIGIFATTISAALGNFIGASRVLLALANDEIFGIFLRPAKWVTKGGNPIVAVVVSFVLVQLVLFIGKLNLIAPAVTVFFLLAYASVNLACALLDMASASNFRPGFKYFTWYTSMFGVVACLIMCFLVNFEYAIGLVILFIVLIVILYFRDMDYNWGNIAQGLLYHQVRKYLLLLDTRKSHVKYWRPQILLLMSNARSQAGLIQFINSLKKGGLFVLGHVIKGDFEKMDVDPASQMHNNFLEIKDFLNVKAFVDITVSKNIREGCRQLSRLSGLGGMTINTVCLGFRDNSQPKDILAMMEEAKKNHKRWPFKTRSNGVENNVESDRDSESYEDENINRGKSTTSTPCQITTTPQINVNETTPLMEKKGLSNNTQMPTQSKKSKFIDELPKVRIVGDNIPIKALYGSDKQSTTDCFLNSLPYEEGVYQQLAVMEYIGIIEDCLKLEKNICLCRHFDKMNLVTLKNSKDSKVRYIDVWPINFFQPGSGSYLDTSCMLMLQLSCILSRSPMWTSKFKIRVFICLDYYTVDCSDKNLKLLWEELLIQWRIQAEIVTVSWDDIIVNLEQGMNIKVSSEGGNEMKDMSCFDDRLPDSYVQEVNTIIKSNMSDTTAVCFLYLPQLPESSKKLMFLNQLTILSENLPPTVFVRGQQDVLTSVI